MKAQTTYPPPDPWERVYAVLDKIIVVLAALRKLAFGILRWLLRGFWQALIVGLIITFVGWLFVCHFIVALIIVLLIAWVADQQKN